MSELPSICFVGYYNLPILARGFEQYRTGGEEVQQTLLALGTLIPLDDTFLLVDEDHFGGLLRALRRALPFPEQDGYYNGTPLDSAAALQRLVNR